jgi:hypothetical protein
MPRHVVEAIIRDGPKPVIVQPATMALVVIDDPAERRAQEIAGGNPH